MKAYITKQFGSPEVLTLTETDKPKPKANELLIKVMASTVNAADCNLRGQTYIPSGMGFLAKLILGFKKPKTAVQGSVFAGEVVETGNKTKEFKVGDKVYGTGSHLGGYGEYICRPETGAISIIPENLNFEEAASVPYGALTALYFLKDLANIQKNQKVLIKGAAGGVGTYAIQLAKYFGAEVTAVCSSKNVDFVKSLGAHKVIDYNKEDFSESEEKWDVIVDIVVKKTSFKKYKNSLNPNGYYLAIAGGITDMLQMLKTSFIGSKKVKFGGGESCEKRSNLDFISSLLQETKIIPVVDKVFPFEEMVEAHRYAESGSKKGNIAITIQ
ncbi:MAG: NAD(P)-dependent alcohol dehydrogenase [Marinilabiliales bacterium]|nr:MAG: NAD(P)-dependent alcohol dehydrogenase [Marinilabiliales bacterium]